jgi:hypothetical protein
MTAHDRPGAPGGVLLVRSSRLPGWALPVAGGILVTVTVVLWYTAALWYFHGFRLPGF